MERLERLLPRAVMPTQAGICVLWPRKRRFPPAREWRTPLEWL